MAREFGKGQKTAVVCETSVVTMPSNIKLTGYRANRKMYVDFDDILSQYGISEDEPRIQELTIKMVRPKGSHPELEARKAISVDDVVKTVEIATTKGSPQGKVHAAKDLRIMVNQGAEMAGIKGAIIRDDKLIPFDENGKELTQFEMPLDNHGAVLVTLLGTSSASPLREINDATGCNFYAELFRVAQRRMGTLTDNLEIAQYFNLLISGIVARNPVIQDTEYIQAFVYLVFEDLSEDRKKLIWTIIENSKHDRTMSGLVTQDLLAALGRAPQDVVIAPGKTQPMVTEDDIKAMLLVWRP